LRLRVFGVAARLIRTGRRYLPKISAAWPWSKQITSARTRIDLHNQPGPTTEGPAASATQRRRESITSAGLRTRHHDQPPTRSKINHP
jgi:hypothetical protein